MTAVPKLATDPAEIARVEARNAVGQFDRVLELVHEGISKGAKYRLRPSALLSLNWEALRELNEHPGSYRSVEVRISNSAHQPPEARLVPAMIEELCDYVNDNWQSASAIHLASYVMWKLNWIHPFEDGNGRTSRASSYLVLCMKLGYELPGTNTIPDQIAGNKPPYYDALESADKGDLAPMEGLLESALARQLLSVVRAATSTSGI